MCSKFDEDAKKHSRNGIVYLAHGVRCDSEEKRIKIIDHFRSNAHQAAVDASNFKELWDKQSLSHPWLRILEKPDNVQWKTLLSWLLMPI